MKTVGSHLAALTAGSGNLRRQLSPFVRHNLRTFVAVDRREDLMVLKGFIEAGKVTPVIDRTYPLAEVPDAMRYYEAGHTRGKLVITV